MAYNVFLIGGVRTDQRRISVVRMGEQRMQNLRAIFFFTTNLAAVPVNYIFRKLTLVALVLLAAAATQGVSAAALKNL